MSNKENPDESKHPNLCIDLSDLCNIITKWTENNFIDAFLHIRNEEDVFKFEGVRRISKAWWECAGGNSLMIVEAELNYRLGTNARVETTKRVSFQIDSRRRIVGFNLQVPINRPETR